MDGTQVRTENEATLCFAPKHNESGVLFALRRVCPCVYVSVQGGFPSTLRCPASLGDTSLHMSSVLQTPDDLVQSSSLSFCRNVGPPWGGVQPRGRGPAGEIKKGGVRLGGVLRCYVT